MLQLTRAFPAFALAAVLLVAGCNVFEGAFEEGNGDIDTKVEDARLARTNGDFEAAERILRDAYAEDPDNVVVRLELASTLIQREERREGGINSLDAIGQVATFITETLDSGGGARPGSAKAESCSYGDAEVTREVFDPTAFDAYASIEGSLPVFREVRDLLSGGDGAILPQRLLDLSPCEIVVVDADGTASLAYDRDRVLEDVYASFEGNETFVRTALQLNAVVLMLDSYTGIFEETDDLDVDWYLVGPESDQELAFCAPDALSLDRVYDRVGERVSDVGRALFSIDLLVHDSGLADLEPLRDDALDVYVSFEEDVSQFCD